MNGNPFYIHPGQDYGAQFSSLGQTIGQLGKEKKAEARFNETKAAMQQAWQSGDPNQIAQLAIDYPESQQTIAMMYGFADDKRKGEAVDFTRSVLATDDHGQVVDMYMQRIDSLEEQGRDPTQTIESMQEYARNPQGARKKLEMVFASQANKQEWDAYSGWKGGPKEFAQATGKGMEGWNFDKSTGRYSLDPNYAKFLQSDAAKLANKDMLSSKDVSGINDKVTALVKPAQEIRQAAVDLKGLGANATPADQIAAVFKFMKALDPTSAVRENEVGMIEGAEGSLKGMANMFNRMIGEGGISEAGFKQIIETSEKLANSAIDSNITEVEKYTNVISDSITPKQLNSLRARVPERFKVAAPPPPPQNAQGWGLQVDANGNKAYVGPNGEIEEVR